MYKFFFFILITRKIFSFQNERRIEKTEIIEMAIKYIRSLISSAEKSGK
jgi:hypothetical protein